MAERCAKALEIKTYEVAAKPYRLKIAPRSDGPGSGERRRGRESPLRPLALRIAEGCAEGFRVRVARASRGLNQAGRGGGKPLPYVRR